MQNQTIRLESLLSLASPPDGCNDPALEKLHAEFCERANEHARQRQNVEAERRRFEASLETGDDVVLSDVGISALNIRELELGTWQRELAIRVDLERDYLPKWNATLHRMIQEANANIPKVQASIIQRMIQAGFLDPVVHSLSRSRVMPGMWNEHPEYIAAKHAADTLAELNRRKAGVLNRAAIVALRAEVRELGKSMAGIN